jgi:anthranilate phosphoribosyltransferase
VVGVWHHALVEPVARTLAALGTERAWVVHGRDGLDEVTLADHTVVAEAVGGSVRLFVIDAEDFGLRRTPLDGLGGGDAGVNARIIREVLECVRRDAARSLVVANAAAALHVGGASESLSEAAALAERSLDRGDALGALESLVERTNA